MSNDPRFIDGSLILLDIFLQLHIPSFVPPSGVTIGSSGICIFRLSLLMNASHCNARHDFSFASIYFSIYSLHLPTLSVSPPLHVVGAKFQGRNWDIFPKNINC